MEIAGTVLRIKGSSMSEQIQESTGAPILHPERNHDSKLEIVRNHIGVARSQGDPVIKARAVMELRKHRGEPLVDAFFAVEDKREREAATRLRVEALKRGGFTKEKD